jgi:magnesium transporter
MDIEVTTAEKLDPAVQAREMLAHHVADNVEALNHLDNDVAAAVLAQLPAERAVEILDQPELDFAPDLVELLPPD